MCAIFDESSVLSRLTLLSIRVGPGAFVRCGRADYCAGDRPSRARNFQRNRPSAAWFCFHWTGSSGSSEEQWARSGSESAIS
jgi:hypothetical protein